MSLKEEDVAAADAMVVVVVVLASLVKEARTERESCEKGMHLAQLLVHVAPPRYRRPRRPAATATASPP
jgi:hypothetical protein